MRIWHVCLLSLYSLQHALIDSKLNSLGRRSSSQVVHASLQAFFPSIEMHTRQLSHGWCLQMNIQALTLANESSTICCQVENFFLADFPDGLIDCLYVVWDGCNILDGTIVGNDHVLHVVIP